MLSKPITLSTFIANDQIKCHQHHTLSPWTCE